MNSSVGLKGASVSSTRRHLASAHSHSVERRARIARVAETAGARGLAGKGQRKSSGAVARSAPKGVEDLGNFDDDGIEIEDESDGLSDLDWKGKFFGIYLQLGVWITVLSFAGFTGYKKILESADGAQDVGLLVAPTSAALFLIVSFLAYNSFIQKSEKTD